MAGKLLFPLLKKYSSMCLAMALVCALGISIFVGMSGFVRSMRDALYGYLDDYGYQDITIDTDPTDKDKRELLEDTDGVAAVYVRGYADTVLKDRRGNFLSVRAFSRGTDELGAYYIWEAAALPADRDGVWLEYNFADDNGIRAGDTVELRTDGKYHAYFVEAIVSSPECLAADQVGAGSTNPDFGYLFFDEKLLEDTPFDGRCNQFLIRTEEGADAESVMDAVCETLESAGVTVRESVAFEDSTVVRRIEDNIEPIETMCLAIPGIFFAVILCVLFLCIYILVLQCRKEIGVLRALGFQIREIRGVFRGLAAAISGLGIALAVPLSYGIMRVCADYYRDFFPIPSLPLQFYPNTALIGAALAALICQAAAVGGCRLIAAIRPSEAMRAETPESTAVPRIAEVLTRRAAPMWKFNLTTMLRNKKRLVFTIVCIAATAMMFFASLSFKASNTEIVSQLFDGRIHYDCLFFMDREPDERFLERLNGRSFASDAEKLRYYETDVSAHGRTERITLNAVSPDTDLISIPGAEKIPERGIVLEKYTADALGVSVGDAVCVENTVLTVTAVSEQYTNRISYISLAQSESLGEGSMGAVICRTGNASALLKYIIHADGYLCATFTDSLRTGTAETFRSFDFVVWILLGFSVTIGLVIVLITMRANLLERQRELCVMRTLGFSVGSISRSWLIQSCAQLILALLIGLPAGGGVADWALSRLTTERRTYPFASGGRELWIAAALVVGYVLFSHALAMRGVRRWNLAETVKSSE